MGRFDSSGLQDFGRIALLIRNRFDLMNLLWSAESRLRLEVPKRQLDALRCCSQHERYSADVIVVREFWTFCLV